MKKIITLMLFAYTLTSYAQAPDKISYQAIVRNAGNQLITNQSIGVKISILQGSETGTLKHSETHDTTTNQNGLMSIQIGTGTIVYTIFGSIGLIDWVNGPYFIKTEIDPTGGTNYTLEYTNQLLSVPYALVAQKVITPPDPVFISDFGQFFGQTERNTWIDHPEISITVPQTGWYLVTYFGSCENENQYTTNADIRDISCEVKVISTVTNPNGFMYSNGLNIFQDFADANGGGIGTRYFYRPDNFSKFKKEYLVEGEIVKVQYLLNSFSSSNTLPWNMGETGLSIHKVGF